MGPSLEEARRPGGGGGPSFEAQPQAGPMYAKELHPTLGPVPTQPPVVPVPMVLLEYSVLNNEWC